MAKVLVLPGTIWQAPLVKRLKELEHEVFLVNPIPNKGVSEFADNFFASDIFAIDSIERYAREVCVEAVMSDECDIAMPVVAELGRRLNVPTLSVNDAALYTDKFLMREFSKENGLNSIEYRLCKNVDDAVDFFITLGRPIIIKPLDSNASHGVFKAESEKEIRNHFNEALSFSRVEKAVLAERYIIGTEFTIDGIKTPNGHYTLAISEKKHFKHNDNIANELYFTHTNPNFDYEKLKNTNDAFVMASGLEFGFTHAEYKYENGEYYLIEIGARGGGNMISSIITQHMTGYDTYRYLINCSLGMIEKKDFPVRPEYLERAAVLKFFTTPDGGGRVKKIVGMDALKDVEDIKALQFNFNIGDTIEDAKNDSARIGYYIVCSENKDRLNDVVRLINQNIVIEIDKYE